MHLKSTSQSFFIKIYPPLVAAMNEPYGVISNETIEIGNFV